MPSLHDPLHRASCESRVRALSPNANRWWGTMSPDQMLWHINQALAMNLGRTTGEMMRIPLPRALMKMVALYLPWPRGVPTAPEFTARRTYDFADEQRQCLALIAATADKPLDSEWGTHVAFGKLTGKQASRLSALHLDHHLRQFGA